MCITKYFAKPYIIFYYYRIIRNIFGITMYTYVNTIMYNYMYNIYIYISLCTKVYNDISITIFILMYI